MAIFSKKLRIKNGSGATQVANIYSTANEAGSNYMRATVDGQAAYISLGSTTDANRTSGRVKKTNGVTYAILVSSVPAYGYNYITWNGSFTVPSGVTKLRVTCVGGGAGGMVAYAPNYYEEDANNGTLYTYNGTQGGNTVFGSVVGNGATSAIHQYWHYSKSVGEGYTQYYYIVQRTPSYGTSGGGVYQNSDVMNGGSAVALTAYNGQVIGYAGAGGYGDGGGLSFPGASGYKVVTTVGVSPGQVIGYTIGGGGNANREGWIYQGNHNDHGVGAQSGNPGAILVEWGKGIQ